MRANIKVIDSEGQVLFECPMSESERAYHYAEEMEKMGIEVSLKAPSLPESLALELGMNQEEQVIFQETINGEIESHDTGCCFELSEKKESDES